MGTLVLRDPTVTSGSGATLSQRLPDLAGKTIGAIWNQRPPGDALLSDMLDVLVAEYGAIRGPLKRKPFLGNVAPDDLLAEMAEACDAVVTGVGDCGSCMSGSVLDAIMLERRGIPAAATGAELFINTTGRGMARIQGLADFPLIAISGYVQLEAIRTREERDSVAKFMASKVRDVLVDGTVD